MGKTTYFIGIMVTILIGTYFYMIFCSSCGMAIEGNEPVNQQETTIPAIAKATSYLFAFGDGDYTYNAGRWPISSSTWTK